MEVTQVIELIRKPYSKTRVALPSTEMVLVSVVAKGRAFYRPTAVVTIEFDFLCAFHVLIFRLP